MPPAIGKILVPFPLESSLSGVNKALLPDKKLWYKRKLMLPQKSRDSHYMLHFGAVDFEAAVYINGRLAGVHVGGFQEFSCDISALLKKGNNEVVVCVKDPTDVGFNPRGKQTLKPQGILYTAVSGIWQTVWLETVPKIYIKSIKLIPDIDKNLVNIEANLNCDGLPDYQVVASTSDSKVVGSSNSAIVLPVPGAHLWSPDDPYLYDLSLKLLYKGKVVDSVSSYFGMRKVEIRKDSLGQERILLNNHFTFNLGVLDQGYWPDGIYTAPTDEALKWDITTIKNMGFNTIRKHIKIEPLKIWDLIRFASTSK
jgi:beta-galactosidase/beta-glucuronidase